MSEVLIYFYRISCNNVVGNGALSKVIAVPSYNTMRERIVAVFGSKQVGTNHDVLTVKVYFRFQCTTFESFFVSVNFAD